MGETEYEEVRKTISNSIPSDLPSDHKDALKVRIKYGNEFSLGKRMGLIFQSIDPKIRNIITDDHKKFIGKVLDDRSYLTYYDKASEKNKMAWDDMYLYTWSLKTLLIYLVYKSIGIDNTALAQVLSSNKKFTKPTLS